MTDVEMAGLDNAKLNGVDSLQGSTLLESEGVGNAPDVGARIGRVKGKQLIGILVGLAVLIAIIAFATGPDDAAPSVASADLLNRALAAHNAGKISEAQGLYKELIELEPANAAGHYNLGLIAQTEGNDSVAEAFYRKAISIDPTFQNALFNLAIIRTPSDPAEAIELYEQVVKANPDHAYAYLNLGFVRKQVGDDSQAYAEFTRAATIDPTLLTRIPEADRPTNIAVPSATG